MAWCMEGACSVPLRFPSCHRGSCPPRSHCAIAAVPCMSAQKRGYPQLLPCNIERENCQFSMLAHAKTGLQFRFGAEPSLTMVRQEHGFIFSGRASGWELVCWMMSILSLNALGMPKVYFGDGQGYAHGHTLEFLRERSAFREKKRW